MINIEMTIKITDDTISNSKVAEILKLVELIQKEEDNNSTYENKLPKADVEPVEVSAETEEKPAVVSVGIGAVEENITDLAELEVLLKQAKSLFIRLARQDRSKAESLLQDYGANKFTDLQDNVKDIECWKNFIAVIKEYMEG